MSRKYKRLAAQLRIVQRRVAHAGGKSNLQEASIALHTFHCQLVGRNIHYASHAAAMARPFIGRVDYTRARSLHRAAATQRHEVFEPDVDYDLGYDTCAVPRAFSELAPWPFIPDSAIECSIL